MISKNYLTKLYFQKFELTNREEQLMHNNTWEDSERGKMDNVRNDQSISEIRKFQQILDLLINEYLQI